jgi:CRP-like cAMP-binding protein
LAECGSLLRSFHCPGTACTLILLLMANGPVQPESDLDPTDPYARKAQTFPRLSEEMAARVVAYGTEERLPKGTFVFERGERSVDFFFVLEGDIEIFDFDEDGRPHVLTVHGERQFTGELDLFNDRQILVSGRTGGMTLASPYATTRAGIFAVG